MTDAAIAVRNRSGRAVDLSRPAALARLVFAELRLSSRCALSITYVDLAEMERLHLEHMDEPGATDVLSFPMDELRAPADNEPSPSGELGDIVICPEFAQQQAATAGHPLEEELDLLLVHGILHLLGHDHLEPEEHALMFGLQEQLLSQWKAGAK